MTALKTLTLSLETILPSSSGWDPLFVFDFLLRSASSAHQQLEDITVIMELYGAPRHIQYWNGTSDILLTSSRCPRFRKLAIYVTDCEDNGSGPAFVAMLNASEGMAKLRARPGIEVITMVKDGKWVKVFARFNTYESMVLLCLEVNLWNFAPDKRWENVAFSTMQVFYSLCPFLL